MLSERPTTKSFRSSCQSDRRPRAIRVPVRAIDDQELPELLSERPTTKSSRSCCQSDRRPRAIRVPVRATDDKELPEFLSERPTTKSYQSSCQSDRRQRTTGVSVSATDDEEDPKSETFHRNISHDTKPGFFPAGISTASLSVLCDNFCPPEEKLKQKNKKTRNDGSRFHVRECQR